MYLIISLIVAFIVGFRKIYNDWSWEKKSREWAAKEGRDSYLDRNGYSTSVKTNVSYKIKCEKIGKDEFGNDVYGDILRINPYTGTVIQNITEDMRKIREIQRKKWKEEAIKNGQKYYLYDIQFFTFGDDVGWMHQYETPMPRSALTMWARVEDDKKFMISRHDDSHTGNRWNLFVSLDTWRPEEYVCEKEGEPIPERFLLHYRDYDNTQRAWIGEGCWQNGLEFGYGNEKRNEEKVRQIQKTLVNTVYYHWEDIKRCGLY